MNRFFHISQLEIESPANQGLVNFFCSFLLFGAIFAKRARIQTLIGHMLVCVYQLLLKIQQIPCHSCWLSTTKSKIIA